MSIRSDRERVVDIHEAIEQIERYLGGDRSRFDRDEMLRVWVVYHLQVIGEAARTLTEEFRERYPEIPWSEIIGMRQILVHHYFGLEWGEVWDTARRDVPALRWRLQAVLAELDRGSAD